MNRSIQVGSTLAGYVMQSELGRGGFGTVYLAEDTRSGVGVAVKIIEADLRDEGGQRAFTRFTSEVQTVRRIQHPHVVKVFDAGRGSDGAGHAVGFLAMELLKGGSLRDVVAKHGPQTPARTAVIVKEAASALSTVHALDVIHRDVKPENVLFDETGRTVVVDFGVCRVAREQSLTFTGETMGSMRYLAPEQALGEELDARADEYALAMTAFFALCGEHIRPVSEISAVFRAVTLGQDLLRVKESRIPQGLKSVLIKALAGDRDARFPSTTAFADAFSAAVEALPEATRGTALPRPVEAPAPSSTSRSSATLPTLDPSLLQPVEDEPLPFAEAINALQAGISRPVTEAPPEEAPLDVTTAVRCEFCGTWARDGTALQEHHATCQMKRWHEANFTPSQHVEPAAPEVPAGPELPPPPAPYVREEARGLVGKMKGWLGGSTAGMGVVVDELGILRANLFQLSDKAVLGLGVRGIDLLVDIAVVLEKSGRGAQELTPARHRLGEAARRLSHLCAIIDVEGLFLTHYAPGSLARELNLLEAKNATPARLERQRATLANAQHVQRTMEQQQEHLMMVVHGLVDTAEHVEHSAGRFTPLELRRLCTALDAALVSLGAAVNAGEGR